jgi:hypothetical protein
MPTILLLSDDPQVHEVVNSLEGYTILHDLTVNTPNYDAVLIDCSYPKSQEVQYQRIACPVIYVGETDDLPVFSRPLSALNTDFLLKPLDPTLTKFRIKKCLASEMDREISGWQAFIIHQSHSPLTYLNVVSALLLSGIELENNLTTKDLLLRITEEISQYKHISSGYATLAKLNSGRSIANIGAILQKTIDTKQAVLDNKQLKIRVHSSGQVVEVYADDYLLEIIFDELLKVFIEQAVTATTFLVQIYEVGEETHFKIIDDRHGFDMTDVWHLPSYLWRLRRLRFIVAAQNGTFEITSEVNKGTTVHFMLPTAPTL